MKQVTPSPKKGLPTVGGLSEEVMLAVYVTAFEQKMERSLREMCWRDLSLGWILLAPLWDAAFYSPFILPFILIRELPYG